jgi:hypothetical protein
MVQNVEGSMTLPALRIILADLAKCIPETVLPSSTWEDLFGPAHLHDAIWCPQLIICDRLEDETERTIKWEDAMKWRTVQDVLDFLEARECEDRG